MRRLLILWVCLISSLVAYHSTSYAQEPRDRFTFDDNGKLTTKSGKPERTFSLPAVKTGFIVDFNNKDLMPYLSLEIVTAYSLALDAGVAQSRVFMSFDFEIVPIIRIGPSIWVGYNVKEADVAFGVGVTILNF